jgi:hypothetical protein
MPNVVCDTSVFSNEERAAHAERGRRLFARLERAVERADGYTLFFPADVREELELWIPAERRCCPFLEFDLVGADETLVMTISGPPEAREILRAGFAAWH